MKRYLIALAILFLAIPVDASSIDVNASAALEGNFGLEVTMDGVVDNAYVLDETPDNETVYRAEFKLDWNDLSYEYCLPQATSDLKQRAYHAIAVIWDLDGVGSKERQFITVLLKCVNDGTPEPRPVVWVRTYDPTHPSASGTGMLYREDGNGPIAVNLPKASQTGGWPCTIRVEYQQASGAGANDGLVRLTRANNWSPTTFQGKTQSQIRQHVRDVDRFQMGATGGTDAGTSGSYYLDTFQSFRTLAP